MKMNKVLNQLLVVFFAALSVVSCLPEADYSQTAVVSASFEYVNAPFDTDSLFYKSDRGAGIGWGSLGFMHKVDTTSWLWIGKTLISIIIEALLDITLAVFDASRIVIAKVELILALSSAFLESFLYSNDLNTSLFAIKYFVQKS